MTPAVRVRPELAESVRDRWPDVDEDWARAVERELDEVCARFGAVPSKVLPARFSFVVVANTRYGDLVVRVTPDPDAMNRGRAAQLLGECGAGPRVHEVRATALGVWTISDRVVPGTSLHGAPLSFNLELMVAPFRALAQVRVAPDSFSTLGEWLRHRLAQSDLRDVPAGESVASLDEREDAQDTLDWLEADVDPTKLCHGDADLGNLLLSAPTTGLRGRLRLVGQQRVNLIEPRGVRGEVEYDIAVLALKHASYYNTEAAKGLCIQLAVYAEVDVWRAVTWLEVAYAARV